MSFSASKSHRLVRNTNNLKQSEDGRRGKSPSRAKLDDPGTKRRGQALGISYLRGSRNNASPKQESTKPGNLALQVMERIRNHMLEKRFGSTRKRKDLKSIFSQLDVDKSGQLDKNEFHHALKSLGIEITREEFNDVFLVFDPNNTGGIDYDEFVWAYYNRRSFKNAASPKKKTNSSSTRIKTATTTTSTTTEESKRPKYERARLGGHQKTRSSNIDC